VCPELEPDKNDVAPQHLPGCHKSFLLSKFDVIVGLSCVAEPHTFNAVLAWKYSNVSPAPLQFPN
jgi:Na+/pantothenate symporter